MLTAVNSPTPDAQPVPGARRSYVVCWLLGGVLLAVVALTFLPTLLRRSPRVRGETLAVAVPPAVAGWNVQVTPIANTPGMVERVEYILQYDDAICRTYTKNGVEIEVYAAYWSPGKVPDGVVGVHTPDTCWVKGGWTCVSRASAQRREIGGRRMKPFEHGSYKLQGVARDVMFWHLVGGQPHKDYGWHGWVAGAKGWFKRMPLVFVDLKNHGLNLGESQMFIRISSSVPFEQIYSDPDVQTLLGSLSKLDVFESGG